MKPEADVTSLLGKEVVIPKDFIPKTRLDSGTTWNDRRHTIALVPQLCACEFCESFKAETGKPDFDTTARRIRRICKRKVGLPLATNVEAQSMSFFSALCT